MLSENGLQQTHARCWACSRHPSAAAQHSFDVRTALHGSVLSASRQASRRKKKISCLTFNANTNEQTTHDPSWASCAVPPGYSTTPQDPIPPISHHGRQRSVSECDQLTPGICDQRGPRVVPMAGGEQHQMLCAASHSLLGSGKPCGHARDGSAGKRGYEPFVTQMSHSHVYLATQIQGQPCTK